MYFLNLEVKGLNEEQVTTTVLQYLNQFFFLPQN